MNIMLISTYTAQLIKSHLEEQLKAEYPDTTVGVSEYNIIHDLVAENSLVYQQPCDLVILLFLRDDVEKIEDFLGYLKILRERFLGTILISNFIAPTLGNLYDVNQRDSAADHFQAMQAALKNFITQEKPLNTYLLDLNSLAARLGHDNFFDPRLWYAFQIPFTKSGSEAVANLAIRAIKALVKPRKKCIVLDCDNTLWGGIIGEDGLEGIKLGPDYPGNCYQDFQRQLLELKKIGFILALNSKNNEPDVLEVFRKHPSQIIREDDFVCKRINWHNKVDNMIEIARELNLGLDSFIFIDDNPAEIHLLKDHLPGIATLLFPKEAPYKIAELLHDHIELFDTLQITTEDRQKTDMYLADKARDDLKLSFTNIQDYYRSLEMVMEVRKNSKNDIPRMSQMTMKTNQFNLTTVRRQEEEVLNFINSHNGVIYCFKLVDRFGDNGIVGYAEVQKSADAARIDNFLMSCRVIARDAEFEFLTQILLDLKKAGIASVTAQWQETPKNIICKNFYDTFGFSLLSDWGNKRSYQLNLADIDLKTRDFFQVFWKKD